MPENRTKNRADGRDERGRFVTCGNPKGRPKKTQEMIDIAGIAPGEIRKMIAAEDTPKRIKADLLKWCYEQVYGKARQGVDMEATNKSEITVKLEGELDEWAE